MNKNNTCYVIAEAGLNHNGSINIAKALIDVAHDSGADAVKFQKRTVEKLATRETLDKLDDRFPEFGSTYREIRNHLEFDLDEYIELKRYSESKNLDFIVTAFDEDSVDFLLRVGVDKYKLASHSLTNYNLLKYLAKLKKPTILSTGMAELDEIDQAVKIFTSFDAPLSLLHCVSAYPTPLDECNIKMMNTLIDRYGLDTGYSGHEIGYLPTIAAVAMGAKLIERHYTLDKNMTGFDHKMSLEPGELKSMINDIRSVSKIHGNGKKIVSETEWITRNKYHVSAVSSIEISAGEVLSEKHITYRNPGTGIPRKDISKILGRKSRASIPSNILLSTEMFD
ncbi:N-acetylneuraminate synthase family protein [Candidatus Pseudothioglobus singularis]|jgi:sialic acid synthase SpsE|nr:N-acetylneuraminate synthase family protein [Candidatus Pseudothioglobus singularis]